MAGTAPTINIPGIPGGQIYVSEAGLPSGTQAGAASTSGSWTFTISAGDGVDDLTVGGYRAITDGIFAPGSIAFGPGRLSVTAFNAATGEVTAAYEITQPHESPHAGAQQRYGDFISADVVLSDRDGDQAQSSLLIQIRDDETLTLSQDTATAAPGGAATGNVVTGGTPDVFTADGFSGVTRAANATGSASGVMPERGVLTLEGTYGTLTLDRWGGYTYTARTDAPDGAVEHLTYWATDGDGDEASSTLHVTIEGGGGGSAPGEGQAITSPGPNSTLSGGSGADTITASAGGDTITTGGGGDILVLKTAPWSPHVVKDFTLGTDELDFQALKSVYGGSNPVADRYISFLDDGAGGTKVLYDSDGAGTGQQWPSYILHLQGVSSQGLTWNQLANPGGAPPPADGQPQIVGDLALTVSEANVSNGTAPDAGALVQRGTFQLQAADGVQSFWVDQTRVITDGVFQPITLTVSRGDTLSLTAYDSATGTMSYEYTLKYAKEHPAPASGSTETPPILNQVSLFLDDADGDRASAHLVATILDDKSITHDDTDTVAAGSTTVAAGNVITDASEGDSGDGDTGRDLRGADQANPYGLASLNTGESNVGYMSNGQWTLAGQYGVLKLDILGGYAYTPNAGVTAGAVDTFAYYLKDNDGTPPVTGKLTITFTDGGGSGGGTGGQTITSPGPNSTLGGGAGADTITASQGGDTITGGAGADWFVLNKNPWSPHTFKDFHVGEDRLDLSALLQAARYTGPDPVADKYVWLTDDGAGGLNVLFDFDGAGPNPQWPNFVAKLEGVSAATTTWTQLSGGGTGGGDPPPPPPPGPDEGQVITSPGPGSTLTGGAGADTLNASRGEDVLTGNGGADRFVFADENWAPATITDFDAAEGDKIDLAGVFDDWGYSGTDPFADGRLTLQGDGEGSTRVLLDDDGPGGDWPNYVLFVRGAGLEVLQDASHWIFQ